MAYLVLVLFALVPLAFAQQNIPLNMGIYERCRWIVTSRGSRMFNVTCERGEIINPAADDIDVRSGASRTDSATPQDLIYKLDVDLTDDPFFGFDISPDFLSQTLPEMKILIIRGHNELSFGRVSRPEKKHDLESLMVVNSQIYELREDLLKGFDQLTSVSFIGLNTSDVHENALSGLEKLGDLRFENCNIGEFERDSINANPSLTMVHFINNSIEEFSRGSIRDVKAFDNSRRCHYIAMDNQGRKTPVWEFINNTVDKVDREAIQINLARELVLTGNHIKRIKTNGLNITIGSAVCQSGKADISDNHFGQLDEKAFYIKNKARSEGEFIFTGNDIMYSRFPFLPQSFNFPKEGTKVDGNSFLCQCENSGHSWFIPAIRHAAEPLHSFYKQLWNTGLCTEKEGGNPVRFTEANVDEECHGGKLNLGDSTPDPDVTVPPTPANRYSTKAPDSGSSQLASVSSFLIMITIVKYVL